MSTNRDDIPWLGADFFENRAKFPPEELLKYEGRHVAWSWDGTRIVASAEGLEALDEQLRQAGVDLGRVVYSYVPPADVSFLG